MTDLATLADAADALCNPIRVRQPYEKWDHNRNRKTHYHVHTVPSLLRQLRMARVPGVMYVEDEGGKVLRSPAGVAPARVEAMSAYLQIEVAAANWTIELGVKLRDDPADNIRGLVGAKADSDTLAMVLSDLRRWYGWAATLSGWERPAWKPTAPCPLCEKPGGLRVHLARQTAVCVLCGETWDPVTVQLLAKHVASMTAVPMRDVTGLRLAAVAARRLEEARRIGTEPRPDLPYLPA